MSLMITSRSAPLRSSPLLSSATYVRMHARQMKAHSILLTNLARCSSSSSFLPFLLPSSPSLLLRLHRQLSLSCESSHDRERPVCPEERALSRGTTSKRLRAPRVASPPCAAHTEKFSRPKTAEKRTARGRRDISRFSLSFFSAFFLSFFFFILSFGAQVDTGVSTIGPDAPNACNIVERDCRIISGNS